MTPGARLQAAIDILTTLEDNGTPASAYLRAWARANRYAGSKDRAAIRELIFISFRRRRAIAEAMGNDSPRARALGGARIAWGMDAGQIAGLCGGGKYNAAALNTEEQAALAKPLPDVPNLPAWMEPHFEHSAGSAWPKLVAALDQPAPVDLRVNWLKADRPGLVAALNAVGFSAAPTPLSPAGIRLDRNDEELASADIRKLPLFSKGQIEIQDEGSQIAGLLTGAKPGQQVMDLCAGGGGKTLVLGMLTGGKSGQLYACDVDEQRLTAGQERVRRAGLHNVQPKLISGWSPEGAQPDPDLEAFRGQMDLVVCDVPCSGSGAWRRAPDARWRLTETRLNGYLAAQAGILRRAARLVKPGGRLAYITCSVLAAENQEQIAAFLPQTDAADGFRILPVPELWEAAIKAPLPETLVLTDGPAAGAVHLTPLHPGTDGFFICVLEKSR